MPLIVQKYGGTTVADLDKINQVADRVIATLNSGNKVVVVVSAMAGETDNLEKMAHQLSSAPDPRELDVLLATGEQVTISLLCIALIAKGVKAKSYTGPQASIYTDPVANKARILNIDTRRIAKDLEDGLVVVVAGFQGVDQSGNITTIGRGGSDTTAVALAAGLQADECQIYTDVDGVYSADPRVVTGAKQKAKVTFEEMLEMSSLGAKVLQVRAVECAGRHNVPLRVLSSFKNSEGTLISYEDRDDSGRQIISGITFEKDEARVSIGGLPDLPGFASKVLAPLSQADIEVDMIIQNISSHGVTDLAFTVKRKELAKVNTIIDVVASKLNCSVLVDDKVAKLSLIGIGIRSHVDVASKMFSALGEAGVNIHLISNSEIKISVLIDEKNIQKGVKVLHSAFDLELMEENNKEPVLADD